MIRKPTVIDLFSGCGGLSLGFKLAGYQPVVAIDYDKDACETYRHNLADDRVKIHQGDMFLLDPARTLSELGVSRNSLDILIGGPPCRGFSVAGKRDERDVRNTLVSKFLDWLEFVSPKAFLMENVPGLLAMSRGKIASSVIVRARKLGFNVETKVLNAAEYGVPQTRRRVFFVGLKNGTYRFPLQTHHLGANLKLSNLNTSAAVTVGRAFAGLDPERLGDASDVPNHVSRMHGADQIRRMSFIKPGENWTSLPEDMRRGKNYPSHGYYRLRPDKPSRILPANASSTSVLHPVEDRQITVREFARLQSFPDWFVFCGKKSSWHRQVGDAVPPRLAQKLAEGMSYFFVDQDIPLSPQPARVVGEIMS